MTTGQHKVALTFDFDTITSWLANGQTSPTPISRGEFGLVGAQRLLRLLERFDIQTTWFIPGLTIDLYPEACRAIHGAGHEIAHHGYEHIAPVACRDLKKPVSSHAATKPFIESVARMRGVIGHPRGI